MSARRRAMPSSLSDSAGRSDPTGSGPAERATTASPRLWAIAVNTLAEIRQRRVIWVAVLLALFMVVSTVGQLIFVEKAWTAGEIKVAERLGLSLAERLAGVWALAAVMVAVFLGATAVATEVRAKTIVTI